MKTLHAERLAEPLNPVRPAGARRRDRPLTGTYSTGSGLLRYVLSTDNWALITEQH